jgi:hypothetical protein
LQNVGLFAYNSGFLSTYYAHLSGLYEFAIMLAIVYYWDAMLAAVRKVLNRDGEAPRPRLRRSRERRRA